MTNTIEVNSFKQRILESTVLDPEGIHHEFANGGHGRKLDFDVITEIDPLYGEWVDLNVQAVRQRGQLVLAVVGVANGTNRLARDVGKALDVESLYTRKTSPRTVELTPESRAWLLGHTISDGLVIAVEDVGTTGGGALSALEDARVAGAQQVIGQFTWQRTDRLMAFDEKEIPYNAIIHEPLPTYTPDLCAVEGYCSEGWVLIPHSK